MDKRLDFRYSIPTPPEGAVVQLSPQEAERILLNNLSAGKRDPTDALWQLARFYSEQKDHLKALDCLRKLIDLFPDVERKASCVLAMGQTMEQVSDYEAAIRYYKEALSLEPVQTSTWYFINNNLGFCLNTLGHFAEGEIYCRKALEIDPNRPNAYKNLGIALKGMGNYADAAQCFVSATQANAADPRASKLLEELLVEHPELEFEFADEAELCRKAVEVAAQHRIQLQPVVHAGFSRHLILLWAKCRELGRRILRPR
jgi:tetratricopeptide (TPR) repeat protein